MKTGAMWSRTTQRGARRPSVASTLLFTIAVAVLIASSVTALSQVPQWTTAEQGTSFASIAASFVSRLGAYMGGGSRESSSLHPTKHFTLDSVHHQGTHDFRGLTARYDYRDAEKASIQATPEDLGALRTRRVKTWRPRNPAPYLQAHRDADDVAIRTESEVMDWDEIDVEAPDVTDRKTLLTLAKMASKAYDAPDDPSNDKWHIEKRQQWNLSDSFGWVEDGIRGHVFRALDNSTIVVALKGTSAALLDNGSTSKRDKENDNLLFSCCCARVGWTWHTVCDCADDSGKDGQTCSSTCLTKALIKKSFFYPATTDLFNNISYAYPDAQIWITGHSLGGALGSLIGMTFGHPTVTFEAPAERMAASRLHLPLPTKHTNMDALPITHIYHTGDPIPMGECVGATSLCANFGYAMESRCHAGQTILYDTVGKLGWASSVVKHRISTLIEDLLAEDWDKKVAGAKARARRDGRVLPADTADDEKKKLGAVPELMSEEDCKDCSEWKFTRK